MFVYKGPIKKIVVPNIQPSQKIATRFFPPLPYSKEGLKLLKKPFFPIIWS